MERRTLLQSAALLAAAAKPSLNAAAAAAKAGNGGAIIIAPSSGNIAETTAGKVRGYSRNGIVSFKGIPYAGTTAGANRFQPPVKAAPWPGVRSSLYYGPVCPQGPRNGWNSDETAFMFEWDDGQPGEDCLRVNIWTPALDNKKRPVLFWIHGGGYSAGSGQELKSYDGENLARRGDAIVVSVNHRLNSLGYLNLAQFGEKWASAANAGMLDLVASLEWTRDNIAAFGGDAGNVTIFGQSGGGSKVGVLMAMPAAKGLFHRAIVQSGSSMRQADPERSAKLSGAVLSELGVTAIDALLALPAERIVMAGVEAVRKLAPPGGNVPGSGMGYNWGPTVDGSILPAHSFDPGAPQQTANVPMIIGTVLNEFTTGIGRPEVESMTEPDAQQRLKQRFGDRGETAWFALRRVHPSMKPFDIYSILMSNTQRQNAITQAERKAALGAAPAYLYHFTWQTPVLDGRPRAFHCSELAFVFDNTDRCATMTGGTPEARALAGRMADAWIAFARKGNPNHPGLPVWPQFTAAGVQTMVFDNRCEVKLDPDGEARRALLQT